MADRYPTPTREEEFGVEWAILEGWGSVEEGSLPYEQAFVDAIRRQQEGLTFMRLRRNGTHNGQPAGRREMLVVGSQEAGEGDPPVSTFVRHRSTALAVFCKYDAQQVSSDWKPVFYIPLWHTTDVYCKRNKYRIAFVPRDRAPDFGLNPDSPNFQFREDLNFQSLGGVVGN